MKDLNQYRVARDQLRKHLENLGIKDFSVSAAALDNLPQELEGLVEELALHVRTTYKLSTEQVKLIDSTFKYEDKLYQVRLDQDVGEFRLQ